MAEHSVLFNDEMVRAILDGRKTQTRRPIVPQPPEGDWQKAVMLADDGTWSLWGGVLEGVEEFAQRAYPEGGGFKCPLGAPGDTLWVAEALRSEFDISAAYSGTYLRYRADMMRRYVEFDEYQQWDRLPRTAPWIERESVPRWASRVNLLVKRVWVERVQDVSRLDIVAEGWPADERQREQVDLAKLTTCDGGIDDAAIEWYADVWDALYAKRGLGYDANPWLFGCEFEVQHE